MVSSESCWTSTSHWILTVGIPIPLSPKKVHCYKPSLGSHTLSPFFFFAQKYIRWSCAQQLLQRNDVSPQGKTLLKWNRFYRASIDLSWYQRCVVVIKMTWWQLKCLAEFSRIVSNRRNKKTNMKEEGSTVQRWTRLKTRVYNWMQDVIKLRVYSKWVGCFFTCNLPFAMGTAPVF